MDYVLMPLDTVLTILRDKGIKCRTVCNNYNIKGDTYLVTNVSHSGDSATITYGEFLFNLKED